MCDWERTIFCDEASLNTKSSVRRHVTRLDGEAYLKDCMVPKLGWGPGSVMIWGAVWEGGRSQLVRFDCTGSQGRKGGVTTEIYCEQVTKTKLKRCWNRVNSRWRGYGGARIVEDNVRLHTSAKNRDVGA